MVTKREIEARATRGYQDPVELPYEEYFDSQFGCDDCGLDHDPRESCREAVAVAKLEGGR
jgi:hypothetical protein